MSPVYAERLVLGLLVSLVLAPTAARADEPARVRVETEGECPATVALEAALGSLGIGTDGVGDAAWIVRAIHPTHGATRFELWPPGASAAVERRAIASPDCDALAQTFALIVHTHFTELGLEVAPPAIDTPPIESETPAPDQVVAPIVIAPRAPMRWEIALGVGGGVSVEPLLPSLVTSIDVSWLPESRGPFVLRLGLAASLPTTQITGTYTVSRYTLRPALEAGARFGTHDVWFQALAGVLVDIAAISATEIPLFWRAQPGLDLALGLGIRIGRLVLVRIEASGQAWLTYDRYLADPDLVAQSPRFSAVLSASVVFALDD
jgi:hypothetical protein